MLNLSLLEEGNPENPLDHHGAFTIGWELMARSDMKNFFKSFFRWGKKSAPREPERAEGLRLATATVLKEIRRGVNGSELKHGTRHFRGGAKVYIIDNYPGMCESVVVIGHERHSGRYVQLSLKVVRLENFRVTNVYSPKVLEMVRDHYRSRHSTYDPERAEYFCTSSRQWVECETKRKASQSCEPGC